jgi:hypothetical protein
MLPGCYDLVSRGCGFEGELRWMQKRLIAFVVLAGCTSAPPPAPQTKTWSAPSNPITITGPGTVDPGGTHKFTVSAEGKAGAKQILGVKVFGGGQVIELAGGAPRSSKSEREFTYFEGPVVDFDAGGKFTGEVTLKVAESPFVPLFSLQKAREVPLGLHLEFEVGGKSLEAEVDARGVAPVKP